MPINIFTDYPMSWRPDKSKLKRPYYLSLVKQMKEDIKSGKLLPGTKLPPQRELADFLDIGFSTVTRAYNLSQQQGITYGKIGQGTFISNNVDIDLTISRNIGNSIDELGFVGSFESTNSLVTKTIKDVAKEKELTQLLNYDFPTGTDHQKRVAMQYLKQVGMTTNLENTVIVSGGANALTIALLSLFKAGDYIAVDRFTYANFISLAHLRGIKLIPIADDQDGMRPDSLALACTKQKIKGIYLMPDYSNPTTITLSDKRRRELAKVIKDHGLILIEDDYLNFLNLYRSKPLIKMSSLLPEQSIYIASMSKPLVSGLRVAYMCFPDKFKNQIEDAMFTINVKTSSLDAEIITRLLENGTVNTIIPKKLDLAKKNNKVYDKVFDISTNNAYSFHRWLPIKSHKTGKELEQLLLKKGIRVFHSDRFLVGHYQENEQHFLRISLAGIDDSQQLEMILKKLKGML